MVELGAVDRGQGSKVITATLSLWCSLWTVWTRTPRRTFCAELHKVPEIWMAGPANCASNVVEAVKNLASSLE